jgi:hypothetical protein
LVIGKRRIRTTRVGPPRKRLSYSNLAATLALIIAFAGGTAYAARKYVITSTKQIKPSVVSKLQGAAGPPGPQGIQGIQGNQGAPGTLSSAYFDAYTTTSASTADGGPVTFPTQTETPSGINANGANTVFTPTSTGTYLVVVTLTENPSQALDLQVGGTAVGPSELQSFTRVINVTAGTGISVVDHAPGMPSQTGVGTEITIVRIA